MLKPGYVLVGGKRTYVIEKILGSGGFGITYKVKSRVQLDNILTDVSFAVKEFFPDSCWRGSDSTTLIAPPTKQQEVGNGIKDFVNEALRLQRACHLNSNIVNVNEVFRANGTAYYVLEYLEGGDLRKMVRDNGGNGVSEQQMLNVMLPIGRALQCLHDNSMLHLDIKPDNIVMRRNSSGDDNEPVLIDFGLATHFDKKGAPTTNTPTSGISSGYSPMEQYAQIKRFDPRLDVYAFSATCLYLLTGKDPDEAMYLPPNYVRDVIPSGVSEEVICAIERGMSMRRDERVASMKEMLDMLGNENPPEIQDQILVQPYQQQSAYLPDNVYTQLDNRPRRLQQPTASKSSKKSTLKVVFLSLAIALGLIAISSLVFWAINDKPKKEVVKKRSKSNPKPQSDGPTGDYEEDAMAICDRFIYLAYRVKSQDDINDLSDEMSEMLQEYENYYQEKGEYQEFGKAFDNLDDDIKTKMEKAKKYVSEKESEFSQ